jgi:hypothetical protein
MIGRKGSKTSKMTIVRNQWCLPEAAPTERYRRGTEFVGNQIEALLFKPTHDDIIAGLNWFAHAEIDEMSPELVWNRKCLQMAALLLEAMPTKNPASARLDRYILPWPSRGRVEWFSRCVA